jgi:hypothetical protein
VGYSDRRGAAPARRAVVISITFGEDVMIKRLCQLAFSSIFVVIALVATASAENKTILNPMYGSNRLDWCRDWSVGCGKAAADAYCQSLGYQNASGFSEAVDIGAASPTRLIGTGAVCDQAFCDGFKAITCYKPSPTQAFSYPKYKGNRLDWCRDWAVGCGQAAADVYCKTKGYAHAVDFSEDNDIGGSSPTRLIGTGAICDQDFCDGFQSITCSN